MGILHALTSVALYQVMGEGGENVLRMLGDRFDDRSQRLVRAMRQANERAWRALEVALAGETLWNKLDSATDKAFRGQVRAFLDALPLPELNGKEGFRRQCLCDLQTARRKALLSGRLVPEELAEAVGPFARHGDPKSLLDAERSALEGMAGELEHAGCDALAWLFRQSAQPGQSLIVVAIRFFFRREVESDAPLARGLVFTHVEEISRAQLDGFQRLDAALCHHGQRLAEALDGVVEAVGELRNNVLDLRAELQARLDGLGEQVEGQYWALHAQLTQLLQRLQEQTALPGRDDGLVRELLVLYRELPASQPAVVDVVVPPREEGLLQALRGFLPQDDLHLAPDVPTRKLANACKSCSVPGDERILALIDATVHGTARNALLFGRAAVYYHNDWAARVPGPGTIPYADFAGRRFHRESWSEVGLDRGHFFNRSASQASAEKVVEMLLAIQRVIAPR